MSLAEQRRRSRGAQRLTVDVHTASQTKPGGPPVAQVDLLQELARNDLGLRERILDREHSPGRNADPGKEFLPFGR